MATVIAYVDGFNLYHGLHDKYHRRYLWLDLERLVQRPTPYSSWSCFTDGRGPFRHSPLAILDRRIADSCW